MVARLVVSPVCSVYAAACAASLLLAGCAGTTLPKALHGTSPRPLPAVVTGATYSDTLRALQRLSVHAAEREVLRGRLAQHLVERCDLAVGEDRYDGVVQCVADLAELYTPAEYARAAFPAGLARAARYLVQKGSPRGDEGRVLAGLRIVTLLHPDDAVAVEGYERLHQWGFDARADMTGPLERFEGLVEAWEEHARLSPTPEVMSTLVRLYVERRDALVRLFQSSDEPAPPSAAVFQGVQRTALHVAAVFLREGDTASALTQVRGLGGGGGIEDKLIELLEATRDDGNEGGNALLDLSRAYLESARPDVSRALCLSGLRSRSDDARFPQCLARIAATTGDYAGALAWYADAIALVPDERALYDEILEVLNGLIEQGLFRADATGTRVLAARATEILKERMRRWPKSAPPVAPEALYMAIGLSEMNAGNAKAAEGRFHESLDARPTAPAYLQLGMLLERTGRASEAAAHYDKALSLVSDDDLDAARQRAELWERKGDALRASGQRDAALLAYDKSLSAWTALVPSLRQRKAGAAELRRGVLLGRLARTTDAKAAFLRAIDLAPSMRETYATILAYLAVSAPDAEFAHEVFRTARNQTGLPPEWKVYFALWVRMIAARAGQPVDAEVAEVFASFENGNGWWGKLARFGAGKLDYAHLVDEATGVGERTEAHFYEGARRLSVGDVAGARDMFERVLQTQMVNFYEFAMAQELAPQAAAK